MRIKNLPSIESMDGSQDALVIEQTDGSEDKSRKVSPAQIKQYVLGNSIDDIYSVMGQNGAKNLINYPYYDPSGRSNRGITYTYDKDGIITANGSTDANNQSYMTMDDFSRGLVLPSTKKYTLTCEKTNDNNKGFAVLYFKNADNTAKTVSIHAVYEDGTTRNANSDYVSLLYNNVAHTSVTFWIDTDTIYITQVRIHTNSGTITNAVLKPMLRLAEDTDDTYQPYAKTNKELTEDKAELESVREYVNEFGAKNLIPYPYASDSFSQRGVDFTCLSDGTINANGTNDGTGNSTYSFVRFTLSKGSYVLNGCPIQTDNNYRCGLIRVSDGTTLVSDYGNGANLTLDADTDVRAFVQVMSGKTADNITFKPMLRLASDINDDTYVPFAMTNKQLTEEIGDLSQTGLTGDSVAEQLGTAKGEIGDLSQTTVTGDTVAAQLKSIKNAITFNKVPDSFITLQSGISIVTNQLYKQGNHIFGWVTFGFSAQTPQALKLGVLASGYRQSGIIRMLVGLGTQPWTSEYAGYSLTDTDYSVNVTGYNANIRAAHIHFDYVIA